MEVFRLGSKNLNCMPGNFIAFMEIFLWNFKYQLTEKYETNHNSSSRSQDGRTFNYLWFKNLNISIPNGYVSYHNNKR